MENGQIEILYNWVDEIPLSRPKKNIARDFADGGMAAYKCWWQKLSNTFSQMPWKCTTTLLPTHSIKKEAIGALSTV
jgi:hypothetical protein